MSEASVGCTGGSVWVKAEQRQLGERWGLSAHPSFDLISYQVSDLN